MSKVKIFSDLTNIYHEKYDILITRISEYVDAYSSILEAIYNNKDLVVVVRNRSCVGYLKKMSDRYGNDKIEIEIYSIKQRISDFLEMTIPDYITEDDLAKSKIFEKVEELKHTKGIDFSDLILNSYLGNYFTFNSFPFVKIVDLLKDLDFSQYNDISNNEVLIKVFRNKITQWRESCTKSFERNIIDRFVKDPIKLLEDISKYLLLKNYPRLFVLDVLGKAAEDIEKIGLSDEPFLLDGVDTKEIERNLSLYLKQKVACDLTEYDIKKDIEMVSGLLKTELLYVLELMEKNREIIDFSIIQKVEKKFIIIKDSYPQFEERASRLLSPKNPSCPKSDATLEDWVKWARDEYFPYRFWMEDNEIYNAEVEDYSIQYGDWIYQYYTSLLAGESRMLFRALPYLSDKLKNNKISIIIVIDNFNYKYVSFCKDYFSKFGFLCSLDTELITMVPTDTRTCKKAFFSGEPFDQSNKSYPKLCEELGSLLGKKIEYWHDINMLDMLSDINDGIYMLNYLSIDRELHKSKADSAIPLNSRIKNELTALIDKTINLCNRTGYENDIKIYFVSDHGSTKILKEQKNLIAPEYYIEKTDELSYRMIALDDKRFNTYRKSISNICYVLDKNQYGLQTNYLIAKGYNRFSEPKDGSYIHGGITPEENIVPLLEFEKGQATLIEPDLLLRTTEFRYSVLAKVILTLKNYNKYKLDNLEIIILNQNVRWDQENHFLNKVEGNSIIEIKLDNVRFLRTLESNDAFRIRLKYSYLGKNYENTYEYHISLKSIQENKMDLNDLF